MEFQNLINNLSKAQIDNFLLSKFEFCCIYQTNLFTPNNEMMFYLDVCPNIETALQCKEKTNGYILTKQDYTTY